MTFLNSQADAEARYGQITSINGILTWPNEADWIEKLLLPNWLNSIATVTATGLPLTHIYCNKDMSLPLIQALQNTYNESCFMEILSFDGCFNIRYVRGEPGKLSTHSYGLAIDLNASLNPLRGQSRWSDKFVNCFKNAGFSWGGDFPRQDPMHFSYSWE